MLTSSNGRTSRSLLIGKPNNSHGLQYANNAVEETTGWVQKLQAYAVRLPCIAVFIRHQYLDDLPQRKAKAAPLRMPPLEKGQEGRYSKQEIRAGASALQALSPSVAHRTNQIEPNTSEPNLAWPMPLFALAFDCFQHGPLRIDRFQIHIESP
jgi:hypothetical protein